MECKFCQGKCQKAGKQKNGQQKLYYSLCKKYQQTKYVYQAYVVKIKAVIPGLVRGGSVRGIGRILHVAVSTVMRQIKRIAAGIVKPAIPLNRQSLEMDELRTYIDNKGNQCWVAYALCSRTKQVIDSIVGKRSKRTLRTIVNTLLISGVKMIKTDRLNIYQSLIPPGRHIANAYNINHIERNNLNLRTHLKRLSRRTICFSKSKVMLEACLRICFWGNSI